MSVAYVPMTVARVVIFLVQNCQTYFTILQKLNLRICGDLLTYKYCLDTQTDSALI